MEVLAVGGDEAAAHAATLAAGEVAKVCDAHHFPDDVADGRVLIPGFALANEVGVFGDETAVHHQENTQRLDQRLHLPQVLHGKRLAADEVGCGLHAHEGDIARAGLGDGLAQPVEIHVSLEGMRALRVQRLRPIEFQHLAARQVEMRLGGGEVIIHRYDVAGLDESFGQQVFGGAALMDGQEVFVTEDFADRIEQAVKALRTGVGVIGLHHGGLLIVAHGIGAAIGQHVEKEVAGTEKERVVPRLFDRLQPLASGRQPRFLHNTHLVHFDGDFGSVG